VATGIRQFILAAAYGLLGATLDKPDSKGETHSKPPLFMRTSVRIRALFAALLGGAILTLTTAASEPIRCSHRTDLAGHADVDWEALRTVCQQEHDAFKAGHPVETRWFVNAGNGFTGLPYVVLRVLPELAPEIWGPPGENFGRFGLFADPGRPLPRGVGIASSAGRPVDAQGKLLGEIDFGRPGLHVVSLACGACHTGQVLVGNRLVTIDGAANTQFDVRKWREAFSRTAAVYLKDDAAIQATAQRIARLIDEKPAGYFYPDAYFGAYPGYLNFAPAVEAAQRAAVKANLVPILKNYADSTVARELGIELQRRTSYGTWNAPGLAGSSTGQMDGSGDLVAQLLAAGWAQANPRPAPEAFLTAAHGAMPPFATNTDIPSVWNQQARAIGQWDGSVNMSFWRNLAAQLPIIGDPGKIDLFNTGLAANFQHGLPPVPYPFGVDMAAAVRGESLFRENCASCHKPRNEAVYNYRAIGTDMNRAAVLNPEARRMFLAAFTASCNQPDFRYTDPSGKVVLPCRMKGTDVIADRTDPAAQGYAASVLDGIWARAPYLHNGSVPTLRHLLVPGERPATFLRGALTYDQANLGWTWNPAMAGQVSDRSPTLMIFDTRRDGASNAGHDRNLIVDGKWRRLNWTGRERDVADLIEYLKSQ